MIIVAGSTAQEQHSRCALGLALGNALKLSDRLWTLNVLEVLHHRRPNWNRFVIQLKYLQKLTNSSFPHSP